MDINYTSGQKTRKFLTTRLSPTEHCNLFIISTTGSGKIYMACDLGMKVGKWCSVTKYVRLIDLQSF